VERYNSATQSRVSGAARIEPQAAAIDPDLNRIVAAWPKLPNPIRRAVLALVDAAG
jgi:hypothetical protein